MKRTTLFFLLIALFPVYHYGQICSANPGGDRSICEGEELILLGEDSPLYLDPLEATWEIVSPQISVIYDDQNALVTGVSPSTGGTFSSGTYEFELCVVCVDHELACQSVVITVGEIMNAPIIASHDPETCGGDLTLTGSTPDPGVTTSWFISPQFDGTFTDNGTELILDHNGFGDCTYTVTYIHSIGGCVESDETTVSFIHEYPNMNAWVSDPDSCPSCSKRIRICGTSPGCGGSPSWTASSGNPFPVQMDSPNSSCTWVTVPENGVYTFEYTVDNGSCQSGVAKVTCEIEEQEGFGLTGNEFFTSCEDVWEPETLFLDEPFLAGATYQWSVQFSSIANHGITFTNPNSNETTVNFANAPMPIGPDGWVFRIQVTMRLGNCMDSKIYYYYVNPSIEVNAKDLKMLCGGDPYFRPSTNLSYNGGANSNNVKVTVLSSPSPAVPVGQTTSANTTLDLTEEGTYCFEVNMSRTGTDPSTGISVTCTDIDTFCVIVADVPTIDCGSPIVTCLLTTQLNGNTPTDSNGNPINIPVYWEQVSGPPATIINANSEDPTVTDLEYGETYTFRYVISDDPDCEITCTNTVVVLPEESCEVCELTVKVGECKDGCIPLNVSGAETYMWQPSGAVDVSDPDNPVICNTTGGIFQVFGFIDGAICGTAIVEIEEECMSEPELPCEFSIRKRCGNCSCGTPVGGARIYDSNGNWLNTGSTGVNVEWSVDGGPWTPGTGSWAQYYTNGSYILCARVFFDQSDGTVCDTTMCVEVACHGDCPTVSFATCADAPFSGYPECEDFNPDYQCGYGSFYGWVWAIDGAGNPIDDFLIDWNNTGTYNQNPFFINTSSGGSCEGTPVRVGNWAGTCDTLVYFTPDCCGENAPEIYCGKGEEGGFQIYFTPTCGSVVFNVTCVDYGYTEYYELSAEEAQSGVFTLPISEECSWYDISMNTICNDGELSLPSNCIFIDVKRGGCYESNEPCWDWGERSTNQDSKPKSSEDLIFPNPSKDGNFILQLTPRTYAKAGELTITIRNITGKVLQTIESDSGVFTHQIKTSVPDGMYLLSIYDQNGNLMNSEKLIVGNAFNNKQP